MLGLGGSIIIKNVSDSIISLLFYNNFLIFIFYAIPIFFNSQMKYTQFVGFVKTQQSLNCYNFFCLKDLKQVIGFHFPSTRDAIVIPAVFYACVRGASVYL